MKFLRLFSGAAFLLCLVYVKAFGQPKFVDVTEESNIDHHHQGFHYGSGAACGDFNNDGYLDLYVPVGLGHRNLLFLNNGDATFREVALQAGVADTSEGFGAVCGDVDNDGDTDLYVTNYHVPNNTNHQAPNILYLNDGDGTFTDVTATAGVGDPGPSTSAALVDYDGDGLLDIYVVNRSTVNDFPSSFYHNNGDGTFSNIATETGTDFHGGWSLGVGFFDFDNDRDLDIYVADELRLDGLFRNNSDGTYTNVAAEANIRQVDAMGVDFADYDNDGDLDIYVGDFRPDPLFRNNGDGTFTDVAPDLGMQNDGVAWGVNFFDYDNDGDKDLYVINGTNHFQEKDETNVFYRNNGDGTFSLMNESFGLADDGDGRGSVAADFNRDGFVDIFVVNVLRGKSKLYLNQADQVGIHNWITLKLIGTRSNRDAIGARVEVTAGGMTQIDEVRAGSSYASMHPLELEFGLKLSTVVDQIIVRWPSGTVQTLTDVAVNQVLEIEEPSAITSITADEVPRQFSVFQNYPNPFNPETKIRYSLEVNGSVKVSILNMNGQLVRKLSLGPHAAGEYGVTWDGKDTNGVPVASGVYFYRVLFQSDADSDMSETRKMLLIR